MNASILAEMRFFLTSFLWGIVLFLAYDMIRIFRNTIHHKKIIAAVEDICFWITSGILVFQMMYQQNDGVIRWYSIGAIVLGMTLYQHLGSEVVQRIGTRFFLFIKKQILRLAKVLVSPLIYVTRKARRLLGALLGRIKRVVRGVLRKVSNKSKSYTNKLRKTLKNQREKVKIKKRKREKEEPEAALKVGYQRGVLELIKQPKEKGEMSEKK